MKKLVKEEFVRFLFGLAATAIGVFIALWVDDLGDQRKDRDSYHAMLQAVKIEATENRYILEQSFLPHYQNAIVRRDFISTVCDNAIGSRIFLDHAPIEVVTVLTKYSLALGWANRLRQSDEKYKYDSVFYKQWQPDLKHHFAVVLDSCRVLIPRVEAMPVKKD